MQKPAFQVIVLTVAIILFTACTSQTTQTDSTPLPTNIETSPSATPSSEMKQSSASIFTNKKYKFTFEYPEFAQTTTNGDFSVSIINKDIDKKNYTPTDILARVEVNQSKRDFEFLYAAKNKENILSEVHASDATFTKEENLTISNKKAIKYTYYVPGNGTEKFTTTGTVIQNGNDLIEISSWNNDKTAYDKIVNTIKFTE